VVVIPASHEQAILELAHSVETAENEIRRAVENGATLAEARKEFGYHVLQRKT
jgi:regulator of RNase E activity RraA